MNVCFHQQGLTYGYALINRLCKKEKERGGGCFLASDGFLCKVLFPYLLECCIHFGLVDFIVYYSEKCGNVE